MDTNSPFFSWLLQVFASYPWFGFLLMMMGVDYLSGVAAAIYEKKLNSKIGYRGAMKKAFVLLIIAVGFLIERGILATLPPSMQPNWNYPIAKLVAAFFLFNEALSVLENAKRCGVPLPNFLTKGLSGTMSSINNYGEIPPPQVKTTTVTVETKENTNLNGVDTDTSAVPLVHVVTKTTGSGTKTKTATISSAVMDKVP